MSRCTIVVPCYNEAARLDVQAFQEFAAHHASFRFLFVDDGSTDATAALLTSLQQESPQRFGLLRLPCNRGKAEAVRQGVLQALEEDSDYVGYWDADLATPLPASVEFCEILDRNPQLQIVVGARVKLLGRFIRRRALRHYLGRIFATVASLSLGLAIYDTQCGAKIFRRGPEIRALFARPFRSRWIFNVELLARFVQGRKAGGLAPAEQAIYELPLTHWCDVAGSKLRAGAFLRAIWELAAISWRSGRGAADRRQPEGPLAAEGIQPPGAPAGAKPLTPPEPDKHVQQ